MNKLKVAVPTIYMGVGKHPDAVHNGSQNHICPDDHIKGKFCTLSPNFPLRYDLSVNPPQQMNPELLLLRSSVWAECP